MSTLIPPADGGQPPAPTVFYGMGTIEARRGRFRLRVPDGAGGRRELGCFLTREEAERIRAGYAVLASRSEVMTDARTLREYGARWLDRRESKGLANIGTDRSRWKLHVETAPFVDWPMANIGRPGDMQQWIHALELRRATDRHRKGKAADLAVDGAALRQPAPELLPLGRGSRSSSRKNPVAGVELPALLPAAEQEWTYLVPEEQRAAPDLPRDPGVRAPDRRLPRWGRG